MDVKEMFSLKGSNAIITGGTSPLGFAMAEGLAEAGARVVIAGRDEGKCREYAKKLSDITGVKTAGLKIDISSSEMIESCFETACKEIGCPDILVNNASFSAQGSLETMTDKEWQQGIDGTINGVFRCTGAVIRYMKKNKSSSIINIASMYGLVSPDPSIYGNSGFNNPSAYGAGKAAVIQFTRYCAVHLAGYGIRVNSITPGPFPGAAARENEDFMAALGQKVPLGRTGEPHELKGAVVFLSSRASGYVTGHNLVVDGGWTAW